MWLRNKDNSNNTLDTDKTMKTKYFSNMTGIVSTAALVLLLQACSGGSGGGATDKNAADIIGGGDGDGGFTYTGDAPANNDVQSFKREFYDNLVINGRCGDCHTAGGPGPTAFVDKGNVNSAWGAAKTVVNLEDPAASTVVQRVANGHNCWLGAGQTSACRSTMIGYIQAWAAGAGGGSASTVQLLPRTPPRDPDGTKVPPTTVPVEFTAAGATSLHGLLTAHCSECHTATANIPQSPYFASADAQIAWDNVKSKIDVVDPSASRLVIRLDTEEHNCWSPSCTNDANALEAAITLIADEIEVTAVDPALLISKAQILMEDGILAQAGGRYETDIIAEWKFDECISPTDINDCTSTPQRIDTTADSSGVQPEIPLSLSGDYQLLSSGGLKFTNGRATGLANTSSKLREKLAGAGEYSIEAWVIPGNVTQEDTSIISYSSLNDSRNFMVGQTLYDYDFYNRSSVATEGASGGPIQQTFDEDNDVAQATLQHVVATFDPINGRRIYVNGELKSEEDELGGGNLSSWNDTFSVVLGNDASSTRSWSGTLRYAAMHSRALTAGQIAQNFDVGIGVNYFLMFSVSEIIAPDPSPAGPCHEGEGSARINYCYVVFEVSLLDPYAYVFNDPFFVTLREDDFNLPDITIKGIRVGVNGKLAATGQAFTHVDALIESDNYTSGGQSLADIGTIIPLENGSAADVFFLAFEEFNGVQGVVTQPVPAVPLANYLYTYRGEDASEIGVRTFDAINKSFAQITGLSSVDPDIHEVFAGNPNDANDEGIQRQLPSSADFQTYQASHQTAVAQLAIAYCDTLVDDTAARQVFFTDGTDSFDFDARADQVVRGTWGNQVVDPLLDAVLVFDGGNASSLGTQPNRDDTRNWLLDTLILNVADDGPYEIWDDVGETYTAVPDGVPDGLAKCDGPANSFDCPDGRTTDVVKAVCAAVLGSAAVIIQ
jgi:Concanavalin A-like lectin/glucanases superfamily